MEKIKLKSLRRIINDTIFERLRLCNWNRTHAARSLRMSLRTLRNYIIKMKRLGYPIPDSTAMGWKKRPPEVANDTLDLTR